jgi:hypothetical protein
MRVGISAPLTTEECIKNRGRPRGSTSNSSDSGAIGVLHGVCRGEELAVSKKMLRLGGSPVRRLRVSPAPHVRFWWDAADRMVSAMKDMYECS